MIIKIFAAAAVSDRVEMYRQIEGHAWAGDFQRSLGSRDNLFKAMNDNTRVDALKKSISGI